VLAILTVVCFLGFLAVLTVGRAGDAPVMSDDAFTSAHTTLQLLSISAAMSIFGIRWTSGRLSKSRPDLLVGAAFLTVGLFHLFHVLTYPGLLEESQYATYEISTHFRLIARFVLVGALLALAFLPWRRKAELSDSIFIVLGVAVFVIVVFYVVLVRADSLPELYAEGGGLTTYGLAVSYSCVGLFAIGALRYAYLAGVGKDAMHFYTAAALMTAAIGELSFSVHGSTSDFAHLMAHILEFTSFLILFLALLRESVATPFKTLAVSRSVHQSDLVKLEQKTAEAEKAKLRAQAHLDFLAHDVSNIISPIMSYTEMLLAGDPLTPQQRKYLDIILRQAQMGGIFVTNLRRLATAEAVQPDAFVGIDLVKALRSMEDVLRSTHKTKTISIIQSFPVDTQAVAPGGEHIEDVLFQIIRDAVDEVTDNSVRISITVRKVRDEGGRHMWQVSMTLIGHKFSPEALAEAKIIYDPRRRMGRGIASSYAFYSSIVSHFGGRLRIENVADGDKVASRRVTIELPVVETFTEMSGGD